MILCSHGSIFPARRVDLNSCFYYIMHALDVLVRFMVDSDATYEMRLHFAEEKDFVEDWEPDCHELADFGLALTIRDPSSQGMKCSR